MATTLTQDAIGQAIVAVHATKSAVAIRYLYEFMALTVTTWAEASGACWTEFDCSERIWSIPAERSASGFARDLPLVNRVRTILQKVRPVGAARLVFPSAFGKQVSRTSLAGVVRRHGIHAPPSSLRRAFEQWCHLTGVDVVTSGHVLGRPHPRCDESGILEADRRARALMERWEEHILAQIRPQPRLWLG